MVIIIHISNRSYFKHLLLSESEFWAKIIFKFLMLFIAGPGMH